MNEKHGNRWLEREDADDLTVVRVLVEKLEINDLTRSIFSQMYSLVDDVGRKNLVINLAQVEYASSLALGKLVMLNRKILGASGRLALCSLTSHVTEILDVSHLSDLFNIYASEQQARASFTA